MTDKAIRYQLEAAFDQALRHYYKFCKAERTCELDDRVYKKYDGRGFIRCRLRRAASSRSSSCAPSCRTARTSTGFARTPARTRTAEWREKVFKDFLPQPDEEEAKAA
jgi:hypothetical protein